MCQLLIRPSYLHLSLKSLKRLVDVLAVMLVVLLVNVLRANIWIFT